MGTKSAILLIFATLLLALLLLLLRVIWTGFKLVAGTSPEARVEPDMDAAVGLLGPLSLNIEVSASGEAGAPAAALFEAIELSAGMSVCAV